jgi:hypothetical protein
MVQTSTLLLAVLAFTTGALAAPLPDYSNSLRRSEDSGLFAREPVTTSVVQEEAKAYEADRQVSSLETTLKKAQAAAKVADGEADKAKAGSKTGGKAAKAKAGGKTGGKAAKAKAGGKAAKAKAGGKTGGKAAKAAGGKALKADGKAPNLKADTTAHDKPAAKTNAQPTTHRRRSESLYEREDQEWDLFARDPLGSHQGESRHPRSAALSERDDQEWELFARTLEPGTEASEAGQPKSVPGEGNALPHYHHHTANHHHSHRKAL